MGYLIKSSVIDALEEDMGDTIMCYEGKREKDIIAFCYESMERTIESLPQYRVDNVVEEIDLTSEQIREKLEALRIYQEQGLTPDEISWLKERDTEKTPRPISEKSLYATCLNCGQIIFRDHKFCPDCGQRLKREKER